MIEKEYEIRTEDGVPYITFPILTQMPFIRHGFSTRLGGVSEKYLSSMNLSYTRGDLDENVTENYRRICKAMGFCTEQLVFSDQIHETLIFRADEKDRQSPGKEKKLTGIDGLITNAKEVVLVTSYADCVPLFFVDPVKKAIGLSHAGWRGTVNCIGPKTIKRMSEEFGCIPKDIIVVIGPSICQDCYEVGEETADKFKQVFGDQMDSRILKQKTGGKYQLDLWAANRMLLEQSHIPSDQIHVSGLCTCCNSRLLYSHRASHGQRGNLGAFLSIIS